MHAQYISAIRNPAKKDYAKRYQAWLESGTPGNPPDYTCSYLAAQAVRINLHNFASAAVYDARTALAAE